VNGRGEFHVVYHTTKILHHKYKLLNSRVKEQKKYQHNVLKGSEGKVDLSITNTIDILFKLLQNRNTNKKSSKKLIFLLLSSPIISRPLRCIWCPFGGAGP